MYTEKTHKVIAISVVSGILILAIFLATIVNIISDNDLEENNKLIEACKSHNDIELCLEDFKEEL